MDVLSTTLLLLMGVICILFNKQFAEICRQTQLAIWKLDYDLSAFRFPIYVVGVVFVTIGFFRLLF